MKKEEMENRVDENNQAGMRSTSSRGLGVERAVKNVPEMANVQRRALRDIRNFVGGPSYPCAIKRGITESKVPVDSNTNNPHDLVGRRPMTRGFAASLAGKSQVSHQDSDVPPQPIGSERQKRAHSSISNSSNFCDSTTIDVDDFRSADDLSLPLVEMEDLSNNDAELNENEMEDLDMEPVPDIDSCDSRNPLAVVDYVEDIYRFYNKIEDSGCVSPNYMLNQKDINEKMRAILIDWLIEVHYKFELMDETLFLTVNIIDRFLEQETVVRKKLQLVGVTAMLLACKYEEVSVPVVEDLILISDRAYTRAEVIEMERLIVNTLKFNMSVPTPYVFMRRFLKAANSDKKLELLSFFMIELCLVEYQMLKFRPSVLAAAAIYTAQCTIQGYRSWTRTSEFHTNYSEDQLRECSRMMVEFHRNAAIGKLTGVHRKYSTFKFGCTAKSEPALFLLGTRQ